MHFKETSNIDMQLAEIDGLIRALIFMQEEADADKLGELRDAVVAVLYIITDKIRSANGSVAIVQRAVNVELH